MTQSNMASRSQCADDTIKQQENNVSDEKNLNSSEQQQHLHQHITTNDNQKSRAESTSNLGVGEGFINDEADSAATPFIFQSHDMHVDFEQFDLTDDSSLTAALGLLQNQIQEDWINKSNMIRSLAGQELRVMRQNILRGELHGLDNDRLSFSQLRTETDTIASDSANDKPIMDESSIKVPSGSSNANFIGHELNAASANKEHQLVVDSGSHRSSSSSIAFAEPPSLGDVADDLSELSDLELNFDGPIEWHEGDMMAAQSALDSQAIKCGAPLLENAAAKLLLYQGDNNDLNSVDPHTQARLEALLEAAGIGKSSTTDGKAFADPEVLRKLTSSVSCALDEAAAALTRMRSETQSNDVSNDKSLADACTDGDVEAVKRLLSEGRSVHETNEEGEPLLSLACSSGYYELAEVLLRMRANVEDRGIKEDCTPLMEAASGGYVDVVRLLIAYDADVNAQSSAGHTALHHAAVGGHEEVVQVLIASGANVEEQNENGHTPLMESASAGHVGVAKILLNAGAGINTHSNEFKESALTLACYKGHLEMVKFLLEAGADQEHKTDEMHTALMEASMDGHVEVARLLLDSGAQVNMPADSFESPLTLAACGGHVALATLLIERGANLEEANDEGYTPLMEASREGHDDMVVLLITNSADVNAQTEETQETALTLACCGGFLDVAHYLINASANIELGCSTPLMEASQEGHLELVKFLIKQGSNVQALTGTGDTALTYACENGHTDVADVLLQAGAKLEHESEGGRTPLMKAARAGHLCTVQFLISKGAEVNRCTTNNEHTVLSLACAGGHLGVVELLLQHSADPMQKLKDGSTMLIEASKGGHTNVVNLLLDFPSGLGKTIAEVSSEYADSIPMADDLPADLNGSSKDLSLKTTESLASRLEQFIHKMMSQAENSTGTREEQMARKQEILEELQRVEQELKFRTQLAQDSQLSPSVESHDVQSDIAQPSPPLTSLSDSPPNITPSHEYVEHELQQKQQAMLEQQRHEAQLQQQKEYYQAKLQILKQQYQQKQLQLQHQRQQLLSQAASSSSSSTLEQSDSSEPAARQPIPLHIALQNHLHAHHVTEGNVDDLAQALKEWDTRDRNINLPSSQVKPMPSFNLNCKAEEASPVVDTSSVPDLPLRMEDLTFTDTPPSRSLADSLFTLIHGRDYKPSSFDPSLEKAIESTSSLKRPPGEYEMTMKTLQWLKKVDAGFAEEASDASKKSQNHAPMIPVPKQLTKKPKEVLDKHSSTTRITKVLNGYVEPTPAAAAAAPQYAEGAMVPTPQRSTSPPRVPFVDPNAETDSNHDTALTLACAGGHAELVKLLLSRSAEIEHRDKKGFTPLILASTAGHSDVVEILVDNGADIEAQSERTKDTPLSLACSGGRYEVVEILLRLGANKEHRNVSDYTPLSLAASGGYVSIIKLLLSYGAEINSRTGSKLGISPLMLAAMNGHTAAVKLLLDMGSDINAQIETNRNTALTLACFQGRHDVVSLLVDRKANIEHRAKTGLTPLMEAASGGYVEVGRVLLDKSADVNAPPVPSSKDTALTIAADKGHYRFVELLLSRGAAVDVKNKKGNSPLWLACSGGHLDVVQLLVSNHADIDSQDNRRVSSLMTAFRRGHIKVVKWLVRHVSQFPSDPECARYIATINDKDLLKKSQQCMAIIMQAKEQQAREALKNASILLEQIETEKSREEKRKEAAARKREKKKQKRKERQAEQQSGKVSPEPEHILDTDGSVKPCRSLTSSPDPPSMQAVNVPQVSGVSNSTETKTDNVAPSRIKNQQNNGGSSMSNHSSKYEESVDVTNKENTTSKRNRRNKDKASLKTSIAELDDFGDLPAMANGKSGVRHLGTKRERGGSSNISQLDSFDSMSAHKYHSPVKCGASKSALSPSPGKKKREDVGSDWKQVTNKKSKRMSIPSKSVSHVSKSVHAIKGKSGAQIDFEKAEKKSADRTIIIRGSAEAIRNAQNLVSVLLRDPDNEMVTQLPKKLTQSGTVPATAANVAQSLPSSRDSMSSIGTFQLVDYITNSHPQVGGPGELKVKSIQSKPGWPVRPPTASASVWGNPSPANNFHQPGTMSPRSSKLVSVRMPASQPSTIPKQTSEVSRQLFTDSKTPTPPPTATTTKQRVVDSRSPAPMVNQKAAMPIPSPILAQRSGNQPVMVDSGLAPYLPSAVRLSAPEGMSVPQPSPRSMPRNAAAAGYSQFDPNMKKVLTQQQQLLAGHSVVYGTQSVDRSQQVDPNKAPGFRPSVSPQLVSYSVTHPSDETNFSRAPGSRAVSSGDQLMSPMAAGSTSTGGYPLFTDSNGVPPNLHSGNLMNHHFLAALRDQYSTIDQPMTLPRIPSTLNPNASEFTTAQALRFAGEYHGVLHSPGSVQQTSPDHFRSLYPLPSRTKNSGQPTSESENLRLMSNMHQPSVMSPVQMPQHSIAGQQGSFSPSSNRQQMVTPPSDMASLSQIGDHSPSVSVASLQSSAPGDPLAGSFNAIGGERFNNQQIFQGVTDIWSTNKIDDGEWAARNMPVLNNMSDTSSLMSTSSVSPSHSINDSGSMSSLFKPPGAGSVTNLAGLPPQYQFSYASGLSGGAGDGLQNTWNNSPSKVADSQQWPTWNQSNNGG